MSLDEIRKAVPTDKGWSIHEHNGFVHIYDDVSPKPIIRIDPPDGKTNYPHMHFYDNHGNSLDINGRIVDYRSSDAHIPWNNGQ
ncbi:transposase [Streptococcus danieliae]|uniref:Transposase n=2 Tax=Streptococcus acidominimus TaxID=1326 RepID=A0A4Y9FQ04_STRAI|nr:transposase [Streptococcus acidominimus]MBF0839738.1 transposase [Streptococcus acidominimus]MBF0848339.1 transposase [Streptococcus danieliae]TFU30348.1 transposase [Streptococcus acidominimus]